MSSNQPQSGSPAVGAQEFTRACAQFATGVAIATVAGEDGAPRGITVNSFTSVSLDPPLVLICIGHGAPILRLFHAEGRFGLSMLAEDQQRLSVHFARSGEGRFESVPWYAGETGVPLVPGALAAMECRIVRAEAAGDHDILIGEVEHTAVRGGRPLIYFGGAYRRLEEP